MIRDYRETIRKSRYLLLLGFLAIFILSGNSEVFAGSEEHAPGVDKAMESVSDITSEASNANADQLSTHEEAHTAANNTEVSSKEHEEGHEEGHGGPIVHILLSLVVIIIAAKLGGDIALRLGQPEVLGELVVGVLIGNLTLLGFGYFEYIEHDAALGILSELGVILLLFEVGLETNVNEMTKVGVSSLLVAILGVIAPFFLGWGVAAFFAPDAETLVHVFVGATLTATSVGITARVLKDIGKIQQQESKIILGAAVIDDVLGLLTLAVCGGIITAANTGQALEIASFAKIVIMAIGFLAGAVVIGSLTSPHLFRLATNLRSHGLLLASSLAICFGLSYLAALVGLAPIVGAFTAGLILDEVHYKDLSTRQNDATIEQLIAPITSLLVPVFFVIMGAKVDVTVFGNVGILGFALGLTLAAIIGKQVCAFGVREKGLDRLVVGLGMIPRGEVGLIFIGIGAAMKLHGHPVVDSATFGAVVIMVIITTMVTPPLIKWRFGKIDSGKKAKSGSESNETMVNGSSSGFEAHP